ncbi:hypothetical protein Tco_1486493, partial [Tanacetum coccineum]
MSKDEAANNNKASSTKIVFKYGEDDETIVDAVATIITSNADVDPSIYQDDDVADDSSMD